LCPLSCGGFFDKWSEDQPRDPAGRFASTGAGFFADAHSKLVAHQNERVYDKRFRGNVLTVGLDEKGRLTSAPGKQERLTRDLLSQLPKEHLEKAAVNRIVMMDSQKAMVKMAKSIYLSHDLTLPKEGEISGLYNGHTKSLIATRDPAIIMHEFAHSIQEGMKNLDWEGWKKVWKQEIGRGKFTSYSASNPGEGFAEAYAAFTVSEETNRILGKHAPKAHEFMCRLFESGREKKR